MLISVFALALLVRFPKFVARRKREREHGFNSAANDLSVFIHFYQGRIRCSFMTLRALRRRKNIAHWRKLIEKESIPDIVVEKRITRECIESGQRLFSLVSVYPEWKFSVLVAQRPVRPLMAGQYLST